VANACREVESVVVVVLPYREPRSPMLASAECMYWCVLLALVLIEAVVVVEVVVVMLDGGRWRLRGVLGCGGDDGGGGGGGVRGHRAQRGARHTFCCCVHTTTRRHHIHSPNTSLR